MDRTEEALAQVRDDSPVSAYNAQAIYRCGECGAPNIDSANFCQNCGRSLRTENRATEDGFAGVINLLDDGSPKRVEPPGDGADSFGHGQRSGAARRVGTGGGRPLKAVKQPVQVDVAGARTLAEARPQRDLQIEEAAKLLDRGDAECDEGHDLAARPQYLQALKLFHEAEDRGGEAWAWLRLGWVALSEHRLHSRSADSSEDWLTFAAQSPKHADSIAAHENFWANSIQNHRVVAQEAIEASQEAFQKALVLFREVADRTGEAEALDGLGVVARESGLLSDAYSFLHRAYTIFRKAKSDMGYNKNGISNDPQCQMRLAFVLWHIAPVLQRQGRSSEAYAALSDALALFRAVRLSDAANRVKQSLTDKRIADASLDKIPSLWPRRFPKVSNSLSVRRFVADVLAGARSLLGKRKRVPSSDLAPISSGEGQ